MQNLQDLSALHTRRTGAKNEDVLGRMIPYASITVNCHSNPSF